MNDFPPALLDFYNTNKSFTPETHSKFTDARNDHMCAFYPIPFNFDQVACLKECMSIDNLFCDHRSLDTNNGYYHKGWKSITLHGIDKHKTEHYTQYGFNSLEEANYQWTEVCNEIPSLFNFLSTLPYNVFDRVRIMRLEPGGYIMPHSDGKSRMFGPLNIAINQPTDCHFIFEDIGIVPFVAGTGMILDVSKKHAVINFSNEVRYHVIVHGHFNQFFNSL